MFRRLRIWISKRIVNQLLAESRAALEIIQEQHNDSDVEVITAIEESLEKYRIMVSSGSSWRQIQKDFPITTRLIETNYNKVEMWLLGIV
jgi:hypothetical protein